MLIVQIAAGIVLGGIVLLCLIEHARQTRDDPPYVFWGTLAIYGGGIAAVWWALRYFGVV